MTRRLSLAVALLAALVAGAPAEAHYRTAGERCKPVKFTPQSDDIASSIRKKEISCKRARRIVWLVRRRDDATPQGFTCSYRAHHPRNGLSHTDFVCTNTGNRRVSWAQY